MTDDFEYGEMGCTSCIEEAMGLDHKVMEIARGIVGDMKPV
jgi:hypothetical protein